MKLKIFFTLLKNKCRLISSLILFFTFPILSVNGFAKNINIYDNAARTLLKDSQGFIWLSSDEGLIRFDSENSILFNSNNITWPMPFNWVNSIVDLDQQHLLLATDTQGLWLFNKSNAKIKRLDVNIHRPSILELTAYKEYYYLYVPHKIYRVNANTLKTDVIAENITVNTFKNTADSLYVLTSNGVYNINNDQLKLIETGKITSIAADKNKLIIAKNAQIITVDDNHKRQQRSIRANIINMALSHDKKSIFTINNTGKLDQHSLQNLTLLEHSYPEYTTKFVNKLYHDNMGTLWLLTPDGIQRLNNNQIKNHQVNYDINVNYVRLAQHKKQMIMGVSGIGLDEFFQQTDIIPKNINQKFTEKGKKIIDFYIHHHILFIATFDGLWSYNINSQQLSKVNFPDNNKIILKLTFHNEKLYLSSDGNGVYIYDILTNKIVNHIYGKQLSSNEIIDILPINDHLLWLATAAGVDIVNTKSDTITNIKGIDKNKVTSLLKHDNKMFITTLGDGFYVCDLQGELLAHFGKTLKLNFMSLINGEIWVSGSPGLYRINPDSYQISMVANSNTYNFSSKPLHYNNSVYISHADGLLEMPLSPMKYISPKIVISKTTVSGKIYLTKKNIDITSANDVITFDLASLDFRPGKSKRFKYRINGKRWHDINANQLTLTGLSAGDYHIEIMGTDSFGRWSDSKAYAGINVDFPWYWNPISQILYAILFLALMMLTFWLLYLRNKSLKLVYRLLKEEKTYNNQSTPVIKRKLQQAITFISQEMQTSADADKNPSLMENKKQQLHNIITEAIDLLSLQQSSNEPRSLSGSTLAIAIPFLCDYFNKKYHVTINSKLKLNSDNINYKIQSSIYRIVFEAILNGIKHYESTIFDISIKEVNDKVWLIIKDNEKSFNDYNNKINVNMAMFYIRNISTELYASVQNYDNDSNGSEINISIPLMNISYDY